MHPNDNCDCGLVMLIVVAAVGALAVAFICGMLWR